MDESNEEGGGMSETPRTNARVKQMIDNDQAPEGLEYWARDLERELNAANDRIKRLEEAGDYIVEENDIHIGKEVWRKAKEAKP